MVPDDHGRLLEPITTARAPLAEAPTRFSFAVMGDSQPALPRLPLGALTKQIVAEIALLRPAFVLHTGDTIWGYQDTRQEMLNEIDRFRALVDTADVPLFRVPGNHEMQSDPAAAEVLRERWPTDYGSFDVGQFHFVALNTDGVNEEGRVTGDQLAWLESDLRAASGARGIFVVMHRPLHSWFQGDFNEDDGVALRKLFADHGVEAVFAGHDHFYFEELHEGVRYLTVGGGGGTVYTQPQGGGFAHYVLVSVDGGDVRYDVIEPFHLEVAYVAGNDGLEPTSTARVSNSTERDLVARNLTFRVPRLASRDHYRITTQNWDYDRTPIELAATIRDVTDTNDGSVTLALEVPLPAGSGFWVTVEARDPKSRFPAR